MSDHPTAEDAIAERLWRRDETLWGAVGAPELGDRLGWLDIARRIGPELPEIELWAAGVRDAGRDQAVLLGMGGSSLGPEVLRRAFGRPLAMLDSTDPAALREVENAVDLDRAMFIVSSKSGGTIETLSQFRHFFELSGRDGSRFAAVTDAGSPLERLAGELGFARVWNADPEIGGRYSVLSHFGLVPAALAGIPLRPLLESATAELEACRAPADENTGLSLGVELGKLALDGRDKLTFLTSGPFASFGLWAEQLIAESTGKQGLGIVPVDGEAPAPPDSYGDDRVFLHVRADGTHDAAVAALEAAGFPVIEIDGYEGPAELGALFYMFEFATAVAGHVLGINPFDQPNVQEAKDATADALGSGRFSAPFDDDSALAALLDGLEPPGYVAIHAYLKPDPAFEAAAGELRALIRERTRAATTFGYGPRFLHSTGQLHKGGPPVGRFLQLVHDGGDDLPVPGETYTFGQLKNAQAAGDLHALHAHGRPVARLRLDGDPAAALRALTASL